MCAKQVFLLIFDLGFIFYMAALWN